MNVTGIEGSGRPSQAFSHEVNFNYQYNAMDSSDAFHLLANNFFAKIKAWSILVPPNYRDVNRRFLIILPWSYASHETVNHHPIAAIITGHREMQK